MTGRLMAEIEAQETWPIGTAITGMAGASCCPLSQARNAGQDY